MPFIETAQFGDGQSDNIIHYGAIRLRIVGSGKLRASFSGLDDSLSETLLAIPMSNSSGREFTRTANFKGQQAKLRLETDKIKEYVKINKIIIYMKEIWTSYPQTE